MEKSSHSSSSAGGGGGGDSSITTTSTGTTNTAPSITTANSDNNNNNNRDRDVYLKHLNKISHKISKPIRRPPGYDQNPNQNIDDPAQPQVQSQNKAALTLSQPQQPQPQQHQPPVYNINKNDFRDVVQRLTGSPAHERFSTPPPIQPPKPPSSRLQRIRPPPLPQISNRPPTLPPIGNPGGNMLTCANPGGGAGFLTGQRQPLSPLPPFPAVHAAAESPISAYMRFLQNSAALAASPRWNNFPPALQQQQQQQQNIPPPPQAMPHFPLMPTSPLPFGCIPSPRSPYAMLSPSLLFSPTQLGFQQLPLSPTLPVPSPKWKGI